jgi:hypothetical protein
VIHAPKKLTLSASGQENPDFAPEKPHLSGITGSTGHFCCAKWRSIPGNPHSKSLWSPVKPHLSRKLPKRWAEWGREEGPANAHLCLHRQKTVRAGTAWVLWLCGPEKPHLWEISCFTVIPNPLTTFPASAHADPRIPSLQLPQKITLVPVKLHLVGRKALLHKAVPWR